MGKTFTIGVVAQQVGINPKAIRFYEEIGLIKPMKRAENKYRLYSPQNIEELSLIKEARDLGISITEIRKLMIGCVGGDCAHSRSYLLAEINYYLLNIRQRISQLNRLALRLEKLKRHMISGKSHNPSNQYCCNLLKQLSNLSKGGETR